MFLHLDLAPMWHDVLTPLLAAQGLALTPHAGRADLVIRGTNGSPGPPPLARVVDPPPTLVLAMGHDGDSEVARVGPIAVAGVTPCEGCVAAHERVRETIRPLAPRADLDLAMRQLAAAHAAREVRALADHWVADRHGTAVSRQVQVWSEVVLVRPDGMPHTVHVARHPHCGCTWADFLAQ